MVVEAIEDRTWGVREHVAELPGNKMQEGAVPKRISLVCD